MSTQAPDVKVKIDDRVRLTAAVLSITDFPEKAQQRKRYLAHAHARLTSKYLADRGMRSHPAVQSLQAMLDQGAPLEALFALVMHMGWPGLEVTMLPRWVPEGWNKQLWDFYQRAELSAFLSGETRVWEQACEQADNVFASVQFKTFLRPFLGDISESLIFMPNICYPADREVGIRVTDQLIAITEPPQAWGDSPPWPYDEAAMLTHSLRAALTQYARLLLLAYLRANAEKMAEVSSKELPISDQFKAMYPTWEEQFITLFVAAAVAMYLEDHVDPREAKAYILLEKKARGMQILPGTVSVLRRYLQEYGNKYHSLLDFLPVFPVQLRVAKKIMTL